MKIYEIGTGYTSIPAQMGAATEIVVEELTKAMLQQGVDVTILDVKDAHRLSCTLPIEEVYLPQIFSTGAVEKLGIVHKMKRVLYSVSLAFKLRSIIKVSSEHLYLHFHNQYNLFFFLKMTPRKLREKVTIGYTVHSHVWFGSWEDVKDTISHRYFQEVYCCQHADKVFVLNDIVAGMLTEHYNVNRDRVCKVINGVNTNVYNAEYVDTKKLEEVREQYGLKDKHVVLQVGSVCDRKNQLGTLQLLLPIMKSDPRLIFVYVGGIIDTVYARQIWDYANDNHVGDRVIYLGEVLPGSGLNVVYTLADVCIMNSKSEAFALVIAESLSVPRPIFINLQILDSLPFLKERIGDGILPIDEQFSNYLQRVFNEEEYAQVLRQRGREFIEKEYSWKIVAEKYRIALWQKRN